MGSQIRRPENRVSRIIALNNFNYGIREISLDA
jgi:hypothetical protein